MYSSCDSEQSVGFLLLLAICFAIGQVGIKLPKQEPVCTKHEYTWPKPRDEQGRWPGFERWGGCDE